jgi:ketosteroid isomerase-like protein
MYRRSAATPSPLLLAALAAPALYNLYALVVRAVLQHNTRQLLAGNPTPLLRGFAANGEIVLDGQHSWSGRHTGHAAISAFLERLRAERISVHVHETLVTGPPWRTLISARFSDHAVDTDGSRIYGQDHAVMLVQIRWGQITQMRIYEDTQRVARFDEYLASHAAAPQITSDH